VTIAGNPDITFGHDGQVAEFVFDVFLARDSVTEIRMADLHLNRDDVAYEQCIAHAIPGVSNFNYRYSCGDRLIAQVLQSKELRLDRIVPNPTDGNATVSFTVTEEGPVHVELLDGLGRRVSWFVVDARPGVNLSELNLPHSATGMFTVRLRKGTTIAVGRYVKQ
jgi:hypothetical protein